MSTTFFIFFFLVDNFFGQTYAGLMVRLKSRTQCAVDGFWFTQPETGWSVKEWDFELVVRQVQAHRQQNPRFNLSTDLNTIRAEVDMQNALRMKSRPGAESYIVDDGGGGTAPNWEAPRSRSWLNAAGAAKNIATGASVLAEWVGAGMMPVPSAQATSRAGVCAACPANKPGDWTSWFTGPAADLIRSQLSIRQNLNLATPFDEKLNVCEACGCPLKLKVHVPLDHIAAHLDGAVKAKLDPRCWILEESNG